ncbi:MAG: efflux RND transporter periplasmic adaptor subunit [Lutimonas sp.]
MSYKYLALFFVGLLLSCHKDGNDGRSVVQKINVVEVKSENVPIFSDYVGQVYGIKDIPIRARVDGFLEGVHFKEGTKINKGTLLYTIDAQPFEANLASKKSYETEANTRLAFANSEYDRIKPLADMNAVSKSDLDGARARKEASEAELNAAKAGLKIAQIDLSYTEILAPITGIIGKTLAREGEYVGKSPNPVILTTISEIDIVRVQFFLTEAEYLFFVNEFRKNNGIKRNEEEIELSLVLSNGSIHEHKGKVDFIDRGIDAGTGTILVQASFPNPDLVLRPGQFARVRIKRTEKDNVLIVPQRCVSELQGNYSVFTVNEENKIVAKQIEIGERYNDYYVVKSGLVENEKVVIEGLQKVSSGMAVEPIVIEFKSQMKSNE